MGYRNVQAQVSLGDPCDPAGRHFGPSAVAYPKRQDPPRHGCQERGASGYDCQATRPQAVKYLLHVGATSALLDRLARRLRLLSSQSAAYALALVANWVTRKESRASCLVYVEDVERGPTLDYVSHSSLRPADNLSYSLSG